MRQSTSILHRARPLSIAIAAIWTAAPLANAQAGPETDPVTPAPYIRVVDDPEARSIRLEVASRRFEHENKSKPTVRMTGAVHIGDAHFYEAIQEMMDAQDVVLFESVKPSGMGDIPPDATDEQRARISDRRVRLLSLFVERQAKASGSLPADMSEIETTIDERFARILDGARNDAWSRPIAYSKDADGEAFTMTSLGADGEPGGEGAAADISVTAQKPSPGESKDAPVGIQQQLASSLGLVFQPEVMNEGGPNWRNSDMSVDQVQERMEAEGVDASPLFNMLSGDSFAAKFAGFMLKLVTSSEQSRAMTKLMMVEMLGSADELFASGAGGMGMSNVEGMMKVIIEDRNAVVVKDLENIIATEPDVRSVGILYGAGHLANLESRLAAIGYLPVGDDWFPAITVDLNASGITPTQATAMRQMLRSSIERQMKAAQRRR